MQKKYKMIKEGSLFRIKALIDIPSIGVKKGDLGGLIEKESNLSHQGNCWIYEISRVLENARVYGNAQVYGYAQVSENAHVYGYAHVSENARVYENAHVYGYAQVYGLAQVYGNARVYENAQVYGNAQVSQNAKVYKYARVHGNAKISQEMHVKYSKCTSNLSLRENLYENIRVQCNLPVLSDKDGDYVLGYKYVMKTDTTNIFYSKYDPNFIYKIGEWAEARNPDLSNESCASGLHFSHQSYWENANCDTVIQVKCYLDDIITIQEGKIRAKRLLPMAVVKNFSSQEKKEK